MGNTYSQPWNSSQPGYLIILLDQSGSMYDTFGLARGGGGKRKCDMVATVLNNFLNEVIRANLHMDSSGVTTPKARADVSILGYEGSTVRSALGGALAGKPVVSLPELFSNPIAIEKRKQKEMDDTGNVVEIEVSFPIWVQPKAGGGTPMMAALQEAHNLAAQWAASHPNNYPPVIVNVTDGMGDGNPTSLFQAISQITTSDGQALLFNVHITDRNDPEVLYPASEAELPNDQFAKLLFNISSPIPDTSRNLLQSQIGKQVPPGARGMIFNGDAISVRQMFLFSSAPATIAVVDPNR